MERIGLGLFLTAQAVLASAAFAALKLGGWLHWPWPAVLAAGLVALGWWLALALWALGVALRARLGGRTHGPR